MLYYANGGESQKSVLMKIFRSSDKVFIFCKRTALAALGLILAACTTVSPTAGPSAVWTPTPLNQTPAAATLSAATPAATATPVAGGTTLRVWLPPQFAPPWDSRTRCSDSRASRSVQREG